MTARTTTVIKNYNLAATDGRLPGEFADDRRSFDFAPVETLTASGKAQTWTVSVAAETPGGDRVAISAAWLEPAANAGDAIGVVTTRSWVALADGEPGKVKTSKPTRVVRGKNLGRSNATNAVTQALREALAKHAKHRRRSGRVGAPAAFPPMLVQPLGSSRGATLGPADFAKGVTVQRKLDGVRLVAHLDGKAVRIYSRTRADYAGMDHIRQGLAQLFTAGPRVKLAADTKCNDTEQPLGPAYLDGEAYLHGKPLEWISGQARRPDDDQSLEFWVFDCFFPQAAAAGHDVSSARRQEYLNQLFAMADGPETAKHIRRVENFPVTTLGEAKALADQFVEAGYEGAIARKDCAPYRYSYHGYHSSNLVKIKPLFSAEFPVVGYTEGKKGKDKGALIWICEVPPAHAVDPRDVRFSVVPKNMTYAERYRLFTWLGTAAADGKTHFERDFQGQPLTVDFAGRSAKTGKPQQAKALAFRTYEGGPENDPIRAALAQVTG